MKDLNKLMLSIEINSNNYMPTKVNHLHHLHHPLHRLKFLKRMILNRNQLNLNKMILLYQELDHMAVCSLPRADKAVAD